MRRILCLFVATAALAAAHEGTARAQEAVRIEPRFENYRVVVRRRPVVSMNLRGHRLARLYKTLLRQ
jgi:hypothetical protein